MTPFRSLPRTLSVAVLLAAVACAPLAGAQERRTEAPREVVPGVVASQLSADYWIERLRRDADRVILDRDAIATQNAAMLRLDPSLHDIEHLPVTLEASDLAFAAALLGVASVIAVVPAVWAYRQSPASALRG